MLDKLLPENVLVELAPFDWFEPKTVDEAVSILTKHPQAQVIGGGSDLLGLLKDRVRGKALPRPTVLVNMKSISEMSSIKRESASLKVGAAVTITEIEESSDVQAVAPALAQAASQIASAQHRNVGTLGGNICQRPRCWYFRAGGIGESAFENCYKRGGDFCFAVTGDNKYHAILGGELCYIVHPSDTATALQALKAKATVVGPGGRKVVPFDEFFVGPRQNVHAENVLQREEILAQVEIPNPPAGTSQVFLKFKERAVFDFAVASVAAVVTVQDGVVKEASIVLGGVAPTPWRASQAEQALVGKRIDERVAQDVANASVLGARPMTNNAFKVDLVKGLVQRALLSMKA
jgi:xanthine dehydrogenase YagS FAD-binding subunit